MTAAVSDPDAHRLPALLHPPNRPWRVLVVLGVAQLMLVLDATVLAIALPRAQAALGFSDGDRQWVVTAYSLAFGSLLLVGGRLADALGRRRMFVLGLVGFAAASALGGAATDFAMLALSRALQGAFGAVLAPAALALLTTTFTEPAARARAFGCFGAISAAGGSVGLILGGALTQYLDWRWVMYVNVIIAAAGLLGAAYLPRDGHRTPRGSTGDPRGTLLAVTGVVAVVYGLSHAASVHALSEALAPATVSFVASGVVLLVAFVVVERRAAHPLLPMRIVLDRNRGAAFAAMFLSAIGVFGILLFLVYYFETTLGYTPIRTGLAFLPMTATMVVVGGMVNAALAARVSSQALVPTGLLVAAAGMAMLTRIGVEPHYVSTVLPATLVTAVGLGLVFAPCFNLGTAGVDESETGVASAAVHVAQQIGGAIGTALLNTVATAVTAGAVMASASRRATPGEQAAAAVHGYVVGFWVCAVAFGVASLVVTVILYSPVIGQLNRRGWPTRLHLQGLESIQGETA